MDIDTKICNILKHLILQRKRLVISNKPRELGVDFQINSPRNFEDFRDQNGSKKVQEVRFEYYMKKKQAKMAQLREIISQKRNEKQRLREFTPNNQSQYQTTGQMLRKQLSIISNAMEDPMLMSRNNLDISNVTNEEHPYLETTSPFMTSLQKQKTQKGQSMSVEGNYENQTQRTKFQRSPDTVTKRLVTFNNISINNNSTNGNNNNTSTILERGSLKLNLSALIVNQQPDIPLKIQLGFKTPDLFTQQKQQNLEKMTSAKSKLEVLAEKDKVRFEKKIKNEKQKLDKLQEFLEYDEYERNLRIQNYKKKQQNAIKKLEKIDKDIEKKQYQDYKEYLSQRQKQQSRMLLEQQQLTLVKLKENIENTQREFETQQQIRERIKLEEEQAQKRLESITKRLERMIKAITEFKERMKEEELIKLQSELKRFSRIGDKRQKAEEDRKEYMDQLQKLNRERHEKKRQIRNQELKDRDQWSFSVLKKHKRQWDQVMERNQSLEETIQAKRELMTLKIKDNKSSIFESELLHKEHKDKIIQKHIQLFKSLQKSKEKLDQLQISQRVTEIQKKRELFGDQSWTQTLKPRNKLIEVNLKKVVLQEQPAIRSGIMIWNLKKFSSKKSRCDSDD
ncbi:UNKNOWN [Stylonychia lemnae]|uniref:Uncharacterized protein n=1 Tax=Stylonychia lemnae TaxID=5949 RepID=A0A078AQP9_STYLE|nr:UNKNOWN [Stylonychia lemnae]|eukprot:CDW83567.1 UNKNOWN [Stylonychia lemnae]